MLSRTVTVSLALGLLLPILLRADDAQKTLDKALNGKWEGTSITSDGEKAPAEFFMTLLVENDKFTMTEGTRITLIIDDDDKEHEVEDSDTFKGTIKVDMNSSPKTIDFTWQDGTMKGIYDIKGNVMRLCTANVGEDRPTEFSSKKGSGWVMVTLKRAKK
jgi:uncharacterized protein (TIGR03067 family)